MAAREGRLLGVTTKRPVVIPWSTLLLITAYVRLSTSPGPVQLSMMLACPSVAVYFCLSTPSCLVVHQQLSILACLKSACLSLPVPILVPCGVYLSTSKYLSINLFSYLFILSINLLFTSTSVSASHSSVYLSIGCLSVRQLMFIIFFFACTSSSICISLSCPAVCGCLSVHQ